MSSPGEPWHWVPAADSVPYLGLQSKPDRELSLQHKHRLRLAAVHHWCLNTLAPPNVIQDVILAVVKVVIQYIAGFMADDSDTGRHLDHVTTQVAKDRAQYAVDASRTRMQDDSDLRLTRVPTRCQQAAVALVCTLIHNRQPRCARRAQRCSGRLHAPRDSATRCTTPYTQCIPRSLAALGVRVKNPSECPRAADVQLQSPPGNGVMVRTARLRHRDGCCLTVSYVTPWYGHHKPHHPFPGNDDPWPAAVRECLHQCAEDHLQYCRREQGPTDLPGWREALVKLFHTTGTRDPRLWLVHSTKAKQDAQTGPRVTPDDLHLNLGGYRRKGDLTPPPRGLAYDPPVALMYILRDILVDGAHQAPNAEVAWPHQLRPQPHAPTSLWLVTTDEHCAQAAGQEPL